VDVPCGWTSFAWATGSLVERGRYTAVYMFTHEDADIIAPFMEIRTRSGRMLTASAGLLVYLNGRAVAAAAARVGDVVRLGDGRVDAVVNVRMVRGKGLYNPQTLRGDIVVDGVLVSTWTTAVSPVSAVAMLVPFRLCYAVRPSVSSVVSSSFGVVFDVFRHVLRMATELELRIFAYLPASFLFR